MVGAADVDEGEGVGAVEELVWSAEIGHGLPDEDGPGVGAEVGVAGIGFVFTLGDDGGDEFPAAGGRADEVDCAGSEERCAGEVGRDEAFLGCGVAEGAMVGVRGVGVAVPATGGQAGVV